MGKIESVLEFLRNNKGKRYGMIYLSRRFGIYPPTLIRFMESEGYSMKDIKLYCVRKKLSNPPNWFIKAIDQGMVNRQFLEFNRNRATKKFK